MSLSLRQFRVGQRVRRRTSIPQRTRGYPRYARGRSGRLARLRRLRVSRHQRTARVRSRSTFIPCASRRASCGASRRKPKDSVYIDMWDDYLEREKALITRSQPLAALPRLPRDKGGPASPNRGKRRRLRLPCACRRPGTSRGRSGPPRSPTSYRRPRRAASRTTGHAITSTG